MAKPPLQKVASFIHKLSGRHLAQAMDDRALLERFIVWNEKAAFAAIVDRHGALVLGVCRRVLRQAADVDDAFQATFLVLLRKAASITKRQSLASWLHGVAYRVSVRVKAGRVREQPHARLDEIAAPDLSEEFLLRDFQQWLDRAVHRLPERYRVSFILCVMQGKSYAQAGRELGCAEGTVSSRVNRAREQLRTLLNRRGLVLPASVLAIELGRGSAPASPALVEGVLAYLKQGASEGAFAGYTKAGLLAQGVLKAMVLSRISTVTGLLLTVMVGVGVLGQVIYGQTTESQWNVPPAKVAANAEVADDLVGIPSRREGVIAFIGTEIKEGEKVPASQQIPVTKGNIDKNYRLLRIGDLVKKGQLIGEVDDSLARAELSVRQAKTAAAETALAASEKVRDEMRQKWERDQALFKASIKAISAEEVARGKMQFESSSAEAKSKMELVKVAKLELEQAKIILEMYQIRSGVTGIVRRIDKQPGEAVRSLETVVTLEIIKNDNP
jgi:HlyD family secretion protein